MKQIFYRVIYGSDKRNKDTWHYDEYVDLKTLKRLIDWCIEKNLILIEVKAVYR